MNKRNTVVFLVLALIAGTLFFLPNSSIDFLFQRTLRSEKGVLLIKDVYGFVQKKTEKSSQLLSVSPRTLLISGDTFYTHTDSKILFSFKNAFWLMPHSKIEFIKKNSQWVAQLVYGEIKKLPENLKEVSPTVDIFFASQPITADSFSTYDFEPIDIDFSKTEFKELSDNSSIPQNIIEKQIYETLGLHKKFFEGCFIRLYKKTKGNFASGETVFELTIDVTGNISNTRIVRSDIQDESYQKCLKTVLDRVRFRNLPLKEPMFALFPLSVDRP